MYSLDIGSRWVQNLAIRNDKARILVLAPTTALARYVAEDLLLPLASSYAYPVQYKPTSRKLIYGDTESEVYFAVSEEPNNLRGINLDYAWGVGYNAWHNKDENITNINLSLRRSPLSLRETFLLTV